MTTPACHSDPDDESRASEAESRIRQAKQRAVDDATAILEKAGMDAVAILCCYVTESGYTSTLTSFAGNFHAQTGLMECVLNRRRHRERLDMERTDE